MKVLFCFLGFLGCIVFFSIVLDPYNYTKHYKTYQEAITNDFSRCGWIPEFVPEDAYEIKDWHNLSPQAQILSFKFLDSENFKHKIQDYGEKITKTQVNWFPRYLQTESMDFYQMPDHYQRACLIIEWSSKTAYFRSDCIQKDHSTQRAE